MQIRRQVRIAGSTRRAQIAATRLTPEPFKTGPTQAVPLKCLRALDFALLLRSLDFALLLRSLDFALLLRSLDFALLLRSLDFALLLRSLDFALLLRSLDFALLLRSLDFALLLRSLDFALLLRSLLARLGSSWLWLRSVLPVSVFVLFLGLLRARFQTPLSLVLGRSRGQHALAPDEVAVEFKEALHWRRVGEVGAVVLPRG